MKPGESSQRTMLLPNPTSANSVTDFTVSGAVSEPDTISSSRI
jgi:hypothetical protein